MWIRKCPKCGGDIVYKSKLAYNYSLTHNKPCKECRAVRCKECNKQIRHKKTRYCLDCYLTIHLPKTRINDRNDPSSWVRECPICKERIIYNTWEGHYSGTKYNRSCVKCGIEKNRTVMRERFPKKKCCNCSAEVPTWNKCGYCNNCIHIYHDKKKEDAKARNKDKIRIPKDYHEYYTCPKCLQTKRMSRNGAKAAKLRGSCLSCEVTEIRTCKFCQTKFNAYKNSKKERCESVSCVYRGRRRLITSSFIQEATKIHGTRYDYSKVDYTGKTKKVIIICKSHGDFPQLPQDHLNGSGCPCCKSSRGETFVRSFLDSKGLTYSTQHRFPDCKNPLTGRVLSYDFYVPSQNLLIEFDGEQHYRSRVGKTTGNGHVLTIQDFQRIQHRDDIKNKYAQDKNIKLCRISYKQLKNVDTILQKEIYG